MNNDKKPIKIKRLRTNNQVKRMMAIESRMYDLQFQMFDLIDQWNAINNERFDQGYLLDHIIISKSAGMYYKYFPYEHKTGAFRRNEKGEVY